MVLDTTYKLTLWLADDCMTLLCLLCLHFATLLYRPKKSKLVENVIAANKPLTGVHYHPYTIQYLYLATGNNSVVAGPGDNKENVIVPSQSSPLLCILMYMFHVSAKLYLTLSYLYVVFLAQMYSSITYYGSHGSSTLWNLP